MDSSHDEHSYFSRAQRPRPRSASLAESSQRPGQPAFQIPSSRARNVQFRPMDRQQSSVRLRRLRVPVTPAPTAAIAPDLSPITDQPEPAGLPPQDQITVVGRPRASSEPRRSTGDQNLTTADIMKPLPALPEHNLTPGPRDEPALTPASTNILDFQPDQPPYAFHPEPLTVEEQDRIPRSRRGTIGSIRDLARRRYAAHQRQEPAPQDEYDSRIVDLLDVIDPEVSTLSSITNVQNSLFVPSLGRWVDRRPTYDLSEYPSLPGAYPSSSSSSSSEEDISVSGGEGPEEPARPGLRRSHSFSTVLTAPQYAVLPDNATLEGWTAQDIKLLNDHVRHMLHSKRSKLKQRMRAFGKYVRRPLGFFITLYATLITLFGLAWVLFLIGWIYVGSEKQPYIINVIDNVLVALFAIMGDGLAPFRAVDTYHMIFVAHYHRKTWKIRKRLLLSDLKDHNDLPTEGAFTDASDLEAALRTSTTSDGEPLSLDNIAVLPPKEQARLVHHQQKLAKSHTFYKPHETETHRAFPLHLLIVIICLLDLHSCLQISLGAVTWGTDWHTRSAVPTTTILCCSITANCCAGILIAVGDRRTRKKEVIERMFKQDLTRQAMHKVQKRNRKAEERAARRSEDREGFREKLQEGLPWLEGAGRTSSDLSRKGGAGAGSPTAGPGEPRKCRDLAGRFNVAASGPGGMRRSVDIVRKPLRRSEDRIPPRRSEDVGRVPGGFPSPA